VQTVGVLITLPLQVQPKIWCYEDQWSRCKQYCNQCSQSRKMLLHARSWCCQDIDGPKFVMDVVLTSRETTNLPPVLADWRLGLALTYLASAGTWGKQLPIVKVVEFVYTTPETTNQSPLRSSYDQSQLEPVVAKFIRRASEKQSSLQDRAARRGSRREHEFFLPSWSSVYVPSWDGGGSCQLPHERWSESPTKIYRAPLIPAMVVVLESDF
jgi:hypothetical protein